MNKKEILDLVISDNLNEANDVLKAQLLDKVQDRLEEMKQSVGRSMFKDSDSVIIPKNNSGYEYFDKKSLKVKKSKDGIVKRAIDNELADLGHLHHPHHHHHNV